MRVIIVDALHMCYKAAYGGMPSLNATVKVGNELQTVNTAIPTFLIKAVHRWSNGGINPTVVCFDTVGGNASRKAYFASNTAVSGDGYKGGRTGENNKFYESVNTTMSLLYNGGVCCLRAQGYEADDLIKAAVDKAKVDYPGVPIDVITGDVDLVPLVDEQVSVFLSSRKATYATSDSIKKPHYVQLTPDNYQSYMEGLTAFKNLSVPYNTVLLTKMLRGDKSDGIAGYPKFTPTKYRNLIEDMLYDGVDLADLFRYDQPTQTICYQADGSPVSEEVIAEGLSKDTMFIKFGEPPKLTQMREVLSNYLNEDIVNHACFVYGGINLNCAFTNLPDRFKRKPAKISSPIKGYQHGELQKQLLPLKINLPIV